MSSIACRLPCDQRVRWRNSRLQRRHALLVDARAQLLLRLPAPGEQPQAQILILGQAVAPRPRRSAIVEGAEAVELAVAAHARRAPAGSPGLVEVAVDRELDVLHQVSTVAVVDLHEGLDAADLRVSECAAT